MLVFGSLPFLFKRFFQSVYYIALITTAIFLDEENAVLPLDLCSSRFLFFCSYKRLFLWLMRCY